MIRWVLTTTYLILLAMGFKPAELYKAGINPYICMQQTSNGMVQVPDSMCTTPMPGYQPTEPARLPHLAH